MLAGSVLIWTNRGLGLLLGLWPVAFAAFAFAAKHTHTPKRG